MQQGYVKMSSYVLYFQIFMESRESCSATDGRAWKVDGRAQALVGPGLATPLVLRIFLFILVNLFITVLRTNSNGMC